MKSKLQSNVRFFAGIVVGAFILALVLLTMGATNPNRYKRNKWSTNLTGRAWHEFWVDAGAMRPDDIAPPEVSELTHAGTKLAVDVWAFDDVASETVQIKLAMPDIWRGNGYFNIKLYSVTGEASGTFRWHLEATSVSNDDPWHNAMSTSFFWTNTVTAADDLMVTDGRNLGIAGSPVLGDLLYVRITRDIGLWDTCAGDVYLMGISIQYEENDTVWTEWVEN